MSVTLAGVGEGSFRRLLESEGVTVHSVPGTSAPRLFSSYLFGVRRVLRNCRPTLCMRIWFRVPSSVVCYGAACATS